ncbi:hypothetical protein WICPIJ_007966 [Wickerhamomyces pijperi]|uniref:Uncharacterized protein n=1 Tax=Wickerhamomyces pijperi TaxID=599730 RepID=A0A9P8PZI0_WICPI|nr:hypothetical protein WICPIJ_007966 [Wickerhamomyces pijperi]
MTSWITESKLASLSSLLVEKKAISNSSETLVSASNLTKTGLVRPALAKSTNDLGNVAENNKDCLFGGKATNNSFNCSSNPISNKRSASSNTMYSTDFKSRPISIFKCKNLPGVATTMSGLLIIIPNWSSRESPPINKTDLKSEPLENSLMTL